jgi:hypothetical protein
MSNKIKEKMKVTDFKAFLYADDLICGENIKELKIRLAHWERESKNYALQINLQKTVMLRPLRKEERNPIMKISRSRIKQVDRFAYFGSVLEKNCKIQNEISERRRKASQFDHLIKSILLNKNIDSVCKTTMYKVYFKKILLYGAEMWTCTKREKRKIQAIEIKFLKAIMGKTKRDRIRNAHVTEELRMEDIQNQIEGNRLR